MVTIIVITSIIIYILSIFGIRYVYRMMRKYNKYSIEYCSFGIHWIIPIYNTFGFIILGILLLDDIIKGEIILKNKSSWLSKFMNTDL